MTPNQFIVDTQFFKYLVGNLEFYGNGECIIPENRF